MGRPRPGQAPLPLQPVEKPIICSPYVEPDAYWLYNLETGSAEKYPGRRPASYWYKAERVADTHQLSLFAEETRENLPVVNALRTDVKRWRDGGYEGATQVTKELLRYWWRSDRLLRLFFCQLEAAETIIFLNEVRLSNRYLRFTPQFTDAHLERLYDIPAEAGLPPLVRMGCKMATGSGKTVVMAMLIAWAFCNRGRVPSDDRFPSAVLAVCPNLTIKERLQVLRPENPDNYYAAFDLVPFAMRPLMPSGKVLVTNWHLFAPESAHVEAGKSYSVVNKGEESLEAFARRVLGDLYDRAPIMVLNDEAHHAWRPNTLDEGVSIDKDELTEATVWVNGLDTINQSCGIRFCVDLSATPFYIGGTGYPEGSPFPWLVSDFGLVDAIECGIVKIPRLPVSDTTGRPEPKYFRLWHSVIDELQPGEFTGRGARRKPKPEAVYAAAEPALNMLASQWVERFNYIQEGSDAKDKTPPVLIIVCDNTDLAEVFFRNISGEEEREIEETEAEDDQDDENGEEDQVRRRSRGKNKRKKTVYGMGHVLPEYFGNREGFTPTIRIDSKLLSQAESGDPNVSRQETAEQLRKIVATVGKKGEPGEQVRCVVSVAMLNEGWDANNVTHILGVRAFGSQLLCEQVVGRGLRRMDYVPDPETGLLTEEYVDIYGVPFSLIPFRGRVGDRPEPIDRPRNHVRALPERSQFEIRFPVVEGYTFALRRNVITADIDAMEPMRLEPEREPTAVFVKPRVTYELGQPTMSGPGDFEEQTREVYYESVHLQTIQFEIARQVVTTLVGDGSSPPGQRANEPLGLQSRHQLFPQVLRLVRKYIEQKVDFRGTVHPCELGQAKYIRQIVDRLLIAIRPDESQGERPLLPILNRYKPTGTTAEVDFKTTRPCFSTMYSHINLVAADTARWEQSAAFRLEQAASRGIIQCYARNDQLGFTIPYEIGGASHHYEPDFLVRLAEEKMLVLEIKGFETEETRAKHGAARRWVEAVSNWQGAGQWLFLVNRDPQTLEAELRYLLQ